MIYLQEIESFQFEADFMENGIRCIPMAVRIRLDLAGIKLPLAVWCRCSVDERMTLATMPLQTVEQKIAYCSFLETLIRNITGEAPVFLPVDETPAWDDTRRVPLLLQQHAAQYGWIVTPSGWQSLSRLQRFALLKLCRPGHENRNFPIAMKEFNLI